MTFTIRIFNHYKIVSHFCAVPLSIFCFFIFSSQSSFSQSLAFSQSLILRSQGANPSHLVPAGKVWKLENFYVYGGSSGDYCFNVTTDSAFTFNNAIWPFKECNGCSPPNILTNLNNAYWIPQGWYLRGCNNNPSYKYTFFILEFNIVP